MCHDHVVRKLAEVIVEDPVFLLSRNPSELRFLDIRWSKSFLISVFDPLQILQNLDSFWKVTSITPVKAWAGQGSEDYKTLGFGKL